MDVGSHTVKAGFAGEDTPKALFPAVIDLPAAHVASSYHRKYKPDSLPALQAVGLVPEDRASGTQPMETDAGGSNKRRRINNRVYVGSSDLNYRREHMEVCFAA